MVHPKQNNSTSHFRINEVQRGATSVRLRHRSRERGSLAFDASWLRTTCTARFGYLP